MEKVLEFIAQFLTEWSGTPATRDDAVGIVVVAVACIVMLLFFAAWRKSGQIDWDAVEAERKRLEEEE
jgi:hypothetical protein